MNTEGALYQFYQNRLIRRELTLLVTYRQQGRMPRISQLAYWRASFAPLLVGFAFFAMRFLGLGDMQASIVAFSFLIGLIFADIQLFVMNAGTWIFAKRALDWSKVQHLSNIYVGPTANLSKPGVQNKWDEVKVPPAYLKNIAQTYENLKAKSPDLQQLMLQSVEGRSLIFMSLLAFAFASFQPDFRGAILAIYAFFVAWPTKRLKAVIDFHVTWPVLQDAFDWSQIRAMTGKL